MHDVGGKIYWKKQNKRVKLSVEEGADDWIVEMI